MVLNLKEKYKLQTKTSTRRIFLVLLPFLIFIISFYIGPYKIGLKDFFKILLLPLSKNPEGLDPMTINMIWIVRFPRILACLLVGSALALAGACFQSILRNPLADPYTLGVSNGSAFGAALAIILSLSILKVQTLAISFGIFSIFLTFLMSAQSKSLSSLILSGMLVSAFFSSLVSFIKFVADPFEKLPHIVYWLMGSMASIDLKDLQNILPVYLISLLVILLYSWRINILGLGQIQAESFGINAKRDRTIIIFVASVITALSVSISGIIAWIGIVVPHMARLLVGNDFRKLAPASISLGASFLMVVDNVCRSISAMEIPLGVITGLVGIPMFLYFIRRERK